MADENTEVQVEQKQTATEKQGAPASALSQGQGTAGAPRAPEISNKPPVTETAVTPAVETPVVETPVTETPQVETSEFPTYGDDNADAIISIMREAKVTAEEAQQFFMNAAQSLDLSKIDVNGLTAKIGKEKALAVVALAKNYYEVTMSATKAKVDAAYGVVGGKDNYDKMQMFLRAEKYKNPEVKAKAEEWNKMLDASPRMAALAVKEMVETYNKSSSNKSLNIKMVEGEKSASGSNMTTQKLTRNEYLEKMKAAQATGNRDEIARLKSQRAASY